MLRETEELILSCHQKLGSKQALASRLGVLWETIWGWENFQGEPTHEQIQTMREIAHEAHHAR